VKGANNALAATIPLKGYLVVNLDSDGDLVDANAIMYGKDSLDNNKKTYVQLNYQGSNPTLNVRVRIYYNGDFVSFDVWDYNDSPFYFEVFAIGKLAPKDIGLGSTKDVASSLKGSISVWGGMLLDADDEILGTGNVSASLYVPETTYVNQNSWTQDQVLQGNGVRDGLIQGLVSKGYVAATLPIVPTADKAKAAR